MPIPYQSHFVFISDHIDEYVLKDETLIDSDYQSESPLDSTDSQWQQLLKGVVIQMPNANRDSMAYLFLHFRRLIQAECVTKFDETALVLKPQCLFITPPLSSWLLQTTSPSCLFWPHLTIRLVCCSHFLKIWMVRYYNCFLFEGMINLVWFSITFLDNFNGPIVSRL